MKHPLPCRETDNSSMTRELVATLGRTLDRKYSQILSVAQSEWERRFAGKDPSDACVTVRIAPRVNSSFEGDFRRVA